MIQYVSPGEFAEAAGTGLLTCDALGSCIGVVAYHPPLHMGFMLHIMLPGRNPDNNDRENLRYAENAIERLDQRLRELRFLPSEVVVCLAGGANVLQRDDDTICRNNINSTTAALKRSGFQVGASSLGGNIRRTLSLDVADGIVRQTLGDSPEIPLYRYFS